MGKRKKYSGKILCLIILVIVAFVCGIMSSKYLEEAVIVKCEAFFIKLIFAVICLYITGFIQIVIHEGGHLLFGFISGYKFESFRIGSIVLVKTTEGIKLRKFYLAGTGGQCLMSPPEMKNDSCPYVLYNLGGIIANIVTSLVAVILCGLVSYKSYMFIFLFEFALVGLVFAFLNGFPMCIGGINNDGYNALNLRKDKVTIKSFWTQMKINSMITKGIRLKDMDDELFIVPEENKSENPICVAIKVIACSREIDRMNFKKAEEMGQSILEVSDSLIIIHKYMIISEIIFCELVGNNNREYINKLHTKDFKKFLKRSNKYLSILRMKYAYSLLFNNDEEEAKKYLRSFEKLAKNYIHQSEVEGERELIEYVNKMYYE